MSMSFYICNVILSNAKNLYKAFWRCFDFAQHDKEIGTILYYYQKNKI